MTVANTRFYDLFKLIPGLQPTVTDQALILQIQRHLQEIPNATAWVGTEQFTLAGLANAIQKRRDKFFLESGKVFNVSEVAGRAPFWGSLYGPFGHGYPKGYVERQLRELQLSMEGRSIYLDCHVQELVHHSRAPY